MSTVSSIEFKSFGNINYHLYTDFALPFIRLFDARLGKKRISFSLKTNVKIFGTAHLNKVGKNIFDFVTTLVMKYLDKKISELQLKYSNLAIKEIVTEGVCPYKKTNEKDVFRPNSFFYGCDECSGEIKILAKCKASVEVVNSRVINIEMREYKKEMEERKKSS